MEAISGPSAAEPGVAAPLNLAEALLRGEDCCIELPMLAEIFAEGKLPSRFERRIETDEQRLVVIDALQIVRPIGDRDIVVRRSRALPSAENSRTLKPACTSAST